MISPEFSCTSSKWQQKQWQQNQKQSDLDQAYTVFTTSSGASRAPKGHVRWRLHLYYQCQYLLLSSFVKLIFPDKATSQILQLSLPFFFFNFIFPLYRKGIKLSLHVHITITFFPHPLFCCNMSTTEKFKILQIISYFHYVEFVSFNLKNSFRLIYT